MEFDAKIVEGITKYVADKCPDATAGQRQRIAAAMFANVSETNRTQEDGAKIALMDMFLADDLARVLKSDPTLSAKAPSAEALFAAEEKARADAGISPRSMEDKLTRIRSLKAASPDELIEAAKGLKVEETSTPLPPNVSDNEAELAKAREGKSGVAALEAQNSIKHAQWTRGRPAVELQRLIDKERITGNLSASERLTAHRLGRSRG